MLKRLKELSLKADILIVVSLLVMALLVFIWVEKNWKGLEAIGQLGISVKSLETYLAHPDAWDILLLIVITTIMSAVPFLSSSVIAVVNGVLLGPVWGSLINWVGLGLGNAVVFILLSQLKLKEKTTKIGHYVDDLSHFKNKPLGLLLGYMIPFIPSFLVGYTAVQLKLKTKIVLSAIALAALPSSILYATGGDALLRGNLKRIAVVVVVLVLIAALYRLIKHRKEEKRGEER